MREVNETIERANEKLGPAPGEEALRLNILCECGQRGCEQLIEITANEYKAVRSEPTRFVVVRGHEQVELERVVEDRVAFAIIQKLGDAAEVAEETDPEDPNGRSVL